MSETLLDRPAISIPPHPGRLPGSLLERDSEAGARVCPVCGSSATYQTLEGRWGCTSCGSTWS
ncbi:Transposase zinc-ribbon domain-containing protein [Streptomyces sp. TLI_053]|uniref:transposase n=1 Tax=Streptomyces sp. TLI_053 TaxID=1855352 RepID=UPI00087937D5|nr:transposase [Streptomyces sp. TLI_053]SDT62620.1 Transposase zinc-ribbon domain-containing protein [Streptomyces sp. TLI_053]